MVSQELGEIINDVLSSLLDFSSSMYVSLAAAATIGSGCCRTGPGRQESNDDLDSRIMLACFLDFWRRNRSWNEEEVLIFFLR